MTNEEARKLLNEARKHREYGMFPEAIALLHQINNAITNNAQYRYLLAATYYESMNAETALKYAEETLALDVNHKESYELIGDIYLKKNEIQKAEESYLKAMHSDSKFKTVQEKLVKIYLLEKKYESAIEICNQIISNQVFDVSSQKAKTETNAWMLFTGLNKYKAFVYLKKYDDAIAELLKLKEFTNTNFETIPFHFHAEDEDLYKLYYLTNNNAKYIETKHLWLSFYKIEEKILKEWEVEANEGIIMRQQRIKI